MQSLVQSYQRAYVTTNICFKVTGSASKEIYPSLQKLYTVLIVAINVLNNNNIHTNCFFVHETH